jgi:hypothetical protein
MVIDLWQGAAQGDQLGEYECDQPLAKGDTVAIGKLVYDITNVRTESPGKMVAICKLSAASPSSPGVIQLTAKQ